MHSDLAVAARIGTGLGFTPAELTQIQQQVNSAVNAAGSKIEAAILAKGNQAITAIAQQAKEMVATQAAQAGKEGADAAKKAVWTAGLIGGGIGIIGGGLLGLALARRFR